MLDCTAGRYIGQGLERQAVALLLERDIRCDRLFDDPSFGSVEALGDIVELLCKVTGQVRGDNSSIHIVGM